MTSLADELAFAHELADAADAVALPYFVNRSFHLDWKANRTEVTEADRNTESAISSMVLASRPAHGLFGEEHGLVGDASSPWRWVVDPIDGTSNFVRGIPVWASLIALERDGVVVCGVASAPALGHRWWAARGEGAYRDGERIHVSQIDAIEQATVSFSRSGLDDPRTIDLALRAWHAQPFSDFWAHLLVAEGAVEVAVEHEMNPWDNAVLQVVVEEAGGRFTDLAGNAHYDGGSAISTNGVLHDAVVAQFA